MIVREKHGKAYHRTCSMDGVDLFCIEGHRVQHIAQ